MINLSYLHSMIRIIHKSKAFEVLLLNGFIKKSEADYAKQIIITESIINKEEIKND
jgi:hypothetical protein